MERVLPDFSRQLERDVVLDEIRARLLCIPFKLHDDPISQKCKYNIVICKVSRTPDSNRSEPPIGKRKLLASRPRFVVEIIS